MEAIATFLIKFEVHMHILFIIKVKNLVLMEWSYMYPLTKLTMKSRMSLSTRSNIF